MLQDEALNIDDETVDPSFDPDASMMSESSVTGKEYPVKATANCKTSNVVYVIECKRCKKQYVGETENALHIGMNGHRLEFEHQWLDKPVASHFNCKDHSVEDFSISVIKQIHREETNFARQK